MFIFILLLDLLKQFLAESESEVAQLCPTLCKPMDYSLPGSSVHGIFQARVLELVDISFLQKETDKSIIYHSEYPMNMNMLLLLLSCFSCV